MCIDLVHFIDIDECKEGSHSCRNDLEKCENLLGGFRCVPEERDPTRFYNEPPMRPKNCIPGYRFDSIRNNCVGEWIPFVLFFNFGEKHCDGLS